MRTWVCAPEVSKMSTEESSTRWKAAFTSSSQSRAMPKSTTSAPASEAAARSMALFASLIWPGPNCAVEGSQSSSPVDKTPTLGRPCTCVTLRRSLASYGCSKDC